MSKHRVYLDTPPFIDAAKESISIPLTAQRSNQLAYFKLIMEATRAGEIESFTSTLTVVECLHAHGNMSDHVKKVFKSLLTSGQYVTLVTPDPFLAEDARDLRWVHGVDLKSRGADYLHVASALSVKCTEFVTFDGPIRKQSPNLQALGLKVVYPTECSGLSDARKQLLLPGVSGAVVPLHGRKKKEAGK